MERPDVGRIRVEEEVCVQQTQWPFPTTCLADWLQDCQLCNCCDLRKARNVLETQHTSPGQ